MEGIEIKKCLLLLAFVMRVVLGVTISVNLNDSIALGSNNLGISTVGQDFEGNFIVCFQDASAKKFSPDFGSYSILTFPEPVEYFESRSFNMPTVTLSNGSSLSMSTRITVLMSNGLATLRDYEYYTYANPFTYHLNDTVLSQIGYPFTVSGNTQYFHLLICEKSVKMLYAGAATTELQFSSLLGTSTTCLAAIVYKSPISVLGDYINGNYIYFLSLSNNKVYKFTFSFSFRFNFTSNHYNLNSFSYTNSIIYSPALPINYLQIASSLLLMQSNSTGSTVIYNANTSQIGTTQNIPTSQIFQFLYAFGKHYILQSTGMSTLTYNSTANILSYSSLVSALPNNTYDFLWGTYLAPFYTPGQSYIYKGGLCEGQAFMNGLSCVNYSCLVNNCTACNISPYLCSVCQQGFLMNDNYTCSFINQNTLIDSLRESVAFLEQPVLVSKGILAQTISFPASRRFIAPFFVYFGIFDDLYLFQFHDRIYGNTMDDLFSSISDIQNKKWSFINYQDLLRLLHVDPIVFQNITNYQDQYNYFPFKDADHIYVGPQGMWGNCQNFFVVAFPLTIILFVTLRCIFKLLYKFSVSKILRNFQFWPYLFVLLMDGNIQQIGFYMATDWRNIFFFDHTSKWIKAQIIFFGFVFFLMTVCLYYLSYSIYQRLNSYLMDNNLNNLAGQTLFILQTGFKNLFFGVLHSLLRRLDYRHMLLILLTNQIIFSMIFLIAMARKSYKCVLKMWIYSLLNLLKILQIITLYFDYENINNPAIESVQLVLILLQVGIFIIGGFIEAFITLKECIIFIKGTLFTNKITEIKKDEPRVEDKLFENKLSCNGVLVYVKNLQDKSKPYQFKIRRFGFRQLMKPTPIFIKKGEHFNTSKNLSSKLKRQNHQAKKKYLRINFTNPNLNKVEQID